MIDQPVNETAPYWLWINVNDPDDHATIDKIYNAFKEEFGASSSIEMYKAYEKKEKTDQVLNILNNIFAIAIGIMMFLCFFSLTASMSANLYDQSKEIGILRAMGLAKNRIRLLYFYEALILVFASCMLGVFTGMAIGFTMIMQQNLFLQRVDPFFFPWYQVTEILILSIICSAVATFGPTSQLVAKPIASIFRII